MNATLAGLFAAALYWFAESSGLVLRAKGDPFAAALLLISVCCALVWFAHLRSLVQKRLTTRVFRRGNLAVYSKNILQAASDAQNEAELLEQCAGYIRDFVEADRFELIKGLARRPGDAGETPWSWAELPLRFSRGDGMLLILGPRRGSRRYLAEDIDSLKFLAGCSSNKWSACGPMSWSALRVKPN